jgi:hypothetical protein
MRTQSSFLLATLALFLLVACQPSTPVARSTPSPSQPTTPTTGSPPKESKVPQMNGFLKPYGADGANWPPNVEVTIQVYDHPQGQVIFTGKSQTGGDGHFFQDVGLTTRPGMAVAVSYGQDTQSVVLVPLAITAIDPSGDTVSGTATQGAQIVLYTSDHGKDAVLEAPTSEAGQWQADFAGRFDITDSTIVQAVIRDANGNGTAFKTDPK